MEGGVLSYMGYIDMFRCEGHGFQISLHSVNQTLYQSNLRSFECRTDCFAALLILKVQLNLCTTPPLGTERNQPLWRGSNKSECMDCPPKKWPLVEV